MEKDSRNMVNESTHIWDNYTMSEEVVAMVPSQRKEIYGNYESELTGILEGKYK